MIKTNAPTTQNPQSEEPGAPNPAQRLERGFNRIWQTRMQGLPMLHPRVHVQAVGFHKWKYFWLGIIVTPWCMNVILAKGQPSKWKSIPEGRRLHYPFPAGIYDFISVKDRILGEYQMCSLMSPLEEVVSDHDMAVEIAKAALEELMKPEQEPELGEPIPAIQPEVDPETIEKAVETAINRPISRRSFLRPKATQEEQES